jgi:ribosomal protein S18 acetylase RimI-like enzyme
MPDFDIGPMHASDALELAELHMRCFEGYFLTQMGRSFLRRFYAEFARHDFDHTAIGRDRASGRIGGFVVGTANPQAHYRSFYRRNMLVFPALLLERCLASPTVRREMWKRSAHLRTALLTLVPGLKRDASRPVADKGPHQQCPVRLLGIAVAPEYRGTPLAALVGQAFENSLREAGCRRVGSSTQADNKRATAYFKKTGWQVVHASDEGVWFEKEL